MNRTGVTRQAKAASASPPAQGMLQRRCACGNHTIAGSQCAGCARDAIGASSIGAASALLQRQQADGADKPRDPPTSFPVEEKPKEGKAKDDAEKDKAKDAALKAAGELGKWLWEGFSASQTGKHILARNEHDWQPVIKFFKDFADTWVGKIVLGTAAGGAATGAFLGARSARDASPAPDPSKGAAPAPLAPKDEKFFALELKWDFISPPSGITLKTPWLDSPEIGGASKPDPSTTLPPVPQLINPTQKVPDICTPADPDGDRGEAVARSARIYSWVLWKQEQDAAKMNELLRKSMQPLNEVGEIWRPGEPYGFRQPRFTPIQPMFKRADGAVEVADPRAIEAGLNSPAESLDPGTQADMESRFGHDFSRVRVHAGQAADQSAKALNALAYTVGPHVVFGAGQYAPATPTGRRLLAHELTHTIQQSAASAGTVGAGMRVSQAGDAGEREADRMAEQVGEGASPQGDMERPAVSRTSVQRQEAGKPAPLTARSVFPYPEKSRLVLTRLLNDDQIASISRLAASDPNSLLAVRILRAAEGQIATVTSATDDLFEAVIPSVKLPKDESGPEQTVDHVVVRFGRQKDGKFQFELKGGPTTLFEQSGLEASQRSEGEVGLSPGKGPTVILHSDAKTGQLDISGDVGLFEIEALRLTQLPDVPAGSDVEKVAADQIARKAKDASRPRTQQLTVGAGAMSGARWDPVLSASWRLSVNASAKTADLLQIPLQVTIDYAPPRSVLAGVSTGLSGTLPSRLPVNVRLMVGAAGGALETARSADGKSPVAPAFGPTVGAGIGVGGKTFRVELEYKHLFNLAQGSPQVDSLGLGAGLKF